ncbi:hypothetical protein CPC08DRAFT_716567 [Agrocybe pediades]|nr:hypothetical protein CPC08DRAFT_716567 [Agrocybe pediades]
MAENPIEDIDLSVNFDQLDDIEIIWREKYAWLKERGYQLRPRYAPDWKPSWHKTKKTPFTSADGFPLVFPQINDAIHLPSGQHVAIKLVYKSEHPTETEILCHFSSERLRKDPRNHCIPLLEVLRPLGDENDELVMLVMPYVRPIQTPHFDTVGEVIHCIRTLFEGLQLIHEEHVAHRDLNTNNFMMVPDKIYPKGHHPVDLDEKPDLSGPAPFYTRTQRPSKYYIIDFGISTQYAPSDKAPLADTILGGDKTVPEFQNSMAPQNPFFTDIYYAGNTVRELFLQGCPGDNAFMGYTGVEFLQPLIDDMTQTDPSKRPDINVVLERFNRIVDGLSTWKLRAPVTPRGTTRVRRIHRMLLHWGRKVVYIVTRTPAIPEPQ